jgi:hypothetical protein
MRYVLAILAVALLVGPAFAQEEDETRDILKKKNDREIDEQYKSAVKHITDRPVKIDPWGTIRGPEPAADKVDAAPKPKKKPN